MTSGPQPIKELPVDGQGRKIAEAKPLTLSLDFEPALLMASPNGRYLLLLQPALPPGIPYLYERQTQQLRPLLQTNSRWEDMFGWPHQWHPDSRHIVFWFSNNDELWLLDVEAGENTILAFTAGHIFVGSF